MRLKNIDELKQLYIGTRHNKLTVIDVLRVGKQWHLRCKCDCGNECTKELHKVISSHTKTCGGYIHKLEQAERLSKLYKENPEIGKRAGEKISQWYKDENNSEIIKERSDNHREWWNNHSEQREYQSQHMIKKYFIKRKEADYTELISILHPKYKVDLIAGKIKRDDLIETLCPICGNYGKHTFHSLFYVSKSKLKYNHALMCDNCQKEKISHYEAEIANFISTFYSEPPIKNDRTILNGKEIDLYYPEKKIAIEFNGDYWHSEKFKPSDYHYNKFKQCYDNGILLVSVFERKWYSNTEVIKNYLYNLFNGADNSLPYIDGKYIDLNYPPMNIFNLKLENIEPDIYHEAKRNLCVYTCGKLPLTS